MLPIILLLLLIQIANAEITLQPLQQKEYNIGEQLLIQGEISQLENFRGRLDQVLKCEIGEEKINALIVDIKPEKNQQYSTLYTIPQTTLGKCKIILLLKDITGNIKETKEFDIFEVTNELSAIFDLKKTEYQAGDILRINGISTKNSGIPINGIATIKFLDLEGIAFSDSTQINNGIIDYTRELSFMPEGEYKLTIEINDAIGNKKIFTDLYTIKISNSLIPSINFDKNNYNPGDNVEITGIVTSAFNAQIENVEVTVEFDDGTKTEKLLEKSTDTIKASYGLISNIKSGKHTIVVIASDNKGNYGQKEIEFNVIQIPTKLEITIDKTNYNPNAEVTFTVNLNDQAGDPITDTVVVGLIKGKNDVISTKNIKSGNQETINIPEDAEPGEWIIRTEGFGLYNEIPFKVNEYKKLEAQISGTDLILKNIGNVDYKDSITIKSDDKNYIKDIKINVGDNKKIDLSKLLSEGTHSLSLPSIKDNLGKINIPKNEGIFSKLTGGATRNIKSPSKVISVGILMIVIITGLTYIFISKRKKKMSNYVSDVRKKDFNDGQKMLEKLRNKGIRKNTVSRPEYGKATPDDIEDFRKRIANQFKEEERKKSNDDFVNRQRSSMKDNKPNKGLFNMFD